MSKITDSELVELEKIMNRLLDLWSRSMILRRNFIECNNDKVAEYIKVINDKALEFYDLSYPLYEHFINERDKEK